MKNCIHKTTIFVVFAGILMLFALNAQGQMVPHLTYKAQWNKHRPLAYTYNSLWGWTGGGREYAIMGSIDTIYFFDVTDAAHPKLCDARAGRSNSCINREFKTYQHYCYAIGDQGRSSLQIFDLKYLPDSVHKVYDTDTLCQDAHCLFFDNDRLYLTFNKYPRKSGSIIQSAMTVASVANPEAPVFIADLKPGFHTTQGVKTANFVFVHDVFVRNDTAYCCVGDQGIYIYNYKDPQNPVLITSFTADANDGFNHSCWLTADGNELVNAIETAGKPVTLFDVSGLKDTANHNITMEKLCTFDSHADKGSIGHNPFIKGKLIFMSYYHDGVVVFDMSDPRHVKEVASYDTYPQNKDGVYDGFNGCWNVYPYFASGTIIASDITNGLIVLKMDSVSAIDNKYISDDQLQIKVLGNPFGNEIRLLAGAPNGADVQIDLFDMLGRSLYTSPYHITKDQTIITIPYSGPVNTEVLLVVTSKYGRYTRKLVQQE
jgi:choice-of-anchor B domain-containing protein